MKNLLVLLITLLPVLSYGQKLSPIKKQALAEVEGLETQINTVCQDLWDYSETALKEHKSAELLIDILQREGFTIEKGVSGMAHSLCGHLRQW